MRTTIDIEPDVLDAAKELARHKRVGVGKIVSQLLRQALTGSAPVVEPGKASFGVAGFDPFPARGVVVSNDTVNRLRDAEGV
jgi:hypothetical protein